MAKDNNKTIEFLPKNKTIEKSAENLLKKTYKRNARFLRMGTKIKKKHRVAKTATLILTGGLAGFLIYNNILASVYNNNLATGNPHTPENVIDPNDNVFAFGPNGQIETDTMTQEEAAVLLDSFNTILLTDAAQRYGQDVGNVAEVISFNMLPNNLFEGGNEFDKYKFSILFKNDSNDIFALNYLTGKDFESSAETSKDFFADYINYLQYECAIDSCEKLTENLAFYEGNLSEDVTSVGDAYFGYRESGDEYYFVPCYTSGGEGFVYYSQSSTIDSYEKSPTEELKKWRINPQDESLNGVTFDSIPFIVSESLQQVMSILNEKLDVNVETTNNNL